MIELAEEVRHIGLLEVEARHLHLVLMKHIAVGHCTCGTFRPYQVVDGIDALQVHGDTLEAVGDLSGYRVALKPSRLLEVGELGDLHAVQPDFPAQPPGAQRG